MKWVLTYRPSVDEPILPSRVDVFGELGDWRNGIPLERSEVDTKTNTVRFSREFDLPSGVYQYKLYVRRKAPTAAAERGDWILDPQATRTRSSKGLRNSIAVVDGSPEPWLFAPSPPWVEELDRGGLRVLVGKRRSREAGASVSPTSSTITISWSENDGATWSSTTAAHAFYEDEHAFFVAMLPTSAGLTRIAIEENTQAPTAAERQRFETQYVRLASSKRLPAWWKGATIYSILIDRFRPAIDREGWERDPARRTPAGGHLFGIRRSLPELHALGIDTLYLTPVHIAATKAHRYDLVDPLLVDPEIGGEEAYRALIDDAKKQGIRVIQDISFAHAGPGFEPYEDVEKHGASSPYAKWFVWNEGKLVHYGTRTDAPLLDQTNPEVQALALKAVAYYAKLGVSGLRLDMTAEVPLDLGRRIRKRFRELVRDGVVFGEVVPAHAWRWRNEAVVDAATDFGFHETVTELVCNPTLPVAEAFAQLTQRDLLRGGDPHLHAVRFLSTHDHARLATLAAAKGALDRLPLAYVMLITMPGIPMFLYGEELALRAADHDPSLDPEDVWPDRMPMPWSSSASTAHGRDERMRVIVRELLAARRDSEALRSGSFTVLFADDSTVVYRREVESEVIDVAINFAREAKTIELEDDDRPALVPIAAVGGAEANKQALLMPPCSSIIARRERALGRAVSPMIARRNLVLRDRDLVLGMPVASARPSRFFFSVTERCNLRCEHCITHAPERTKDNTARTMTPAVLDALAKSGDLGVADYFAFVHGGESLAAAPIFFDVLESIAAARGREPYVAHLLTNGVLLTLPTAEKLVKHGISSLSISLDGATEKTNDSIRVGGRFHDVRENLRRVLKWRTHEGVNLRVGISTVVLQQNLHELEGIVDLGADLGVDWIKFEEGVPATPFAKRSLVSCTAPEVKSVIGRAITHGRSRGLVMVDHTFDRAVWRCKLDDDTRAFLEADEMANRCVIHPCRTPYETACVEPNGDIRIRDFYGPIVGNVTQTSLVDLWNAPAAEQLRRDTTAGRLCGSSGPVVCLPP